MTPRDEALEASIQHWLENATVTDLAHAAVGVEQCALCDMYQGDDCDGCPVKEATGRRYCRGTPYMDACHELVYGTLDSFKAAAQVELEFLRGLRVPEPATCETDDLFALEHCDMVVLQTIMNTLHGGSDKMRDQGHRLRLLLDRFHTLQPVVGDTYRLLKEHTTWV